MELDILATDQEDVQPRFYGCRWNDIVVGPFDNREEAEAELAKACSDAGTPLAEDMLRHLRKVPTRRSSRPVGGTSSYGVWEFVDGDDNLFYVVFGPGGSAHEPAYNDLGKAESLAGQLQAVSNRTVPRSR